MALPDNRYRAWQLSAKPLWIKVAMTMPQIQPYFMNVADCQQLQLGTI